MKRATLKCIYIFKRTSPGQLLNPATPLKRTPLLRGHLNQNGYLSKADSKADSTKQTHCYAGTTRTIYEYMSGHSPLTGQPPPALNVRPNEFSL